MCLDCIRLLPAAAVDPIVDSGPDAGLAKPIGFGSVVRWTDILDHFVSSLSLLYSAIYECIPPYPGGGGAGCCCPAKPPAPPGGW